MIQILVLPVTLLSPTGLTRQLNDSNLNTRLIDTTRFVEIRWHALFLDLVRPPHPNRTTSAFATDVLRHTTARSRATAPEDGSDDEGDQLTMRIPCRRRRI